jgi:hypothetical protein
MFLAKLEESCKIQKASPVHPCLTKECKNCAEVSGTFRAYATTQPLEAEEISTIAAPQLPESNTHVKQFVHTNELTISKHTKSVKPRPGSGDPGSRDRSNSRVCVSLRLGGNSTTIIRHSGFFVIMQTARVLQ